MSEPDRDEPDPRLGSEVAGKYRILDLVGRGGMGAIYRARHLELGEDVAIKFLHPMYASTADLRARFRREAVAMARLRHRSIVSLLDFGERDGEPYLVMELVVGRPLGALLDAGPLSLPFLGALFDQLLEVLDVAHAAGIVHRDIKPGNVMVVGEEHVKLLDFGLVHLPSSTIDKLTETGMVHGTPDYMSPEQCEGRETGPPSDVYAIGVLLYECLAGQPPFDGEGAAQLMAQHLFVDPPSLRSRGAPETVPRALEDLVRRALAKSPDSRPTAAAMRRELSAILRGTDPLSMAEGAARTRAVDAGRTRGERALTAGGAPPVSRRAPQGLTARVDVVDPARASRIRSALAVGGIGARLVADEPEDEAPGGTDHDPPVVVTIVSALDGLERLERAVRRGHATVVLDVDDVAVTKDIIRLGASDLLVRAAPDAELPARVHRLARRRRRST